MSEKSEKAVLPSDAEQALTELQTSHRAFLAAAARLPEADVAPGGTAREPREAVGAGHYREHAAQIRQWRAR